MATVEEILVRIDATTETLRREMKRGGDEVEKFRKTTDQRAKRIEQRFKKLGSRVKANLVGFAAALSVSSLVSFTRSAIAAGDSIDKASQVAGIAASRLQELRFAFGQLAGTQDREVDESIRRFNRRIGLAAQGMGEAKKTIELMNISLRNQSGQLRSTDDVLEEVLENLASIESDSIRAARASQVFGEDAGPRLAAALGNGIDAMNALRDATPGVLSDEQVARAAALTDEFDRMARTVGGALKGAFIDLAAAIGRALDIGAAFATETELTTRLVEVQARIVRLQNNLNRIQGDNDVARQTRARGQASINKLLAEEAELIRRIQALQSGGGGGGGVTAAQLASLQPINAQDFITTPSTVGRDLLAGIPDVRTGLLQEIDPSERSEFQALLQDMRNDVVRVTESVQYLDEETIARIENMKNSWESLGNAVGFTLRTELTNVFLGIESDWRETIKRMVADWAIQQLALRAASNIGGGFGSFISGVFGRAQGGPVDRGRPFVVGESGPELFVPNIAGRVVNARQTAQMGGVTVNVINRFDVGLESVQGQIAAMTPRIAQATQASLMRALRRPGMV